jgi:hypothetical protein
MTELIWAMVALTAANGMRELIHIIFLFVVRQNTM